jgi:hypothetical protein
VWNLARRRHAGRPVRLEHSLYGTTDVALTHGLRLYILTDRGTTTFTDTPTPVFQVSRAAAWRPRHAAMFVCFLELAR